MPSTDWVPPPEPGQAATYDGKDSGHLEHIAPPPGEAGQDKLVEETDWFPNPRVATGGGVGLLLLHVFNVLQDFGVTMMQSVRELVAFIGAWVMAYMLKERKERPDA